MSITNALATAPVKNLSAAIKWYETLLGRPADSRPMAELAEWKFERGGWLQVYELPKRAGHGSFTLAVDSMDKQAAQLEKLNMPAGERAPGGRSRTLMIKDPDGNHIAFAEAIDFHI